MSKLTFKAADESSFGNTGNRELQGIRQFERYKIENLKESIQDRVVNDYTTQQIELCSDIMNYIYDDNIVFWFADGRESEGIH